MTGTSRLAEAWPPASYRRLRALMDQGKGQRAPGPCAIPGCTLAIPDLRPLAPPFVWDHCHAHDYVRGMLCRTHNVIMGPIDSQDHAWLRWFARRYPAELASGSLPAYWERCPECAASGPWRPIMVRHSPGIVQRSARLGGLAERTHRLADERNRDEPTR